QRELPPLLDRLAGLHRANEAEAEVIVATAHKAKGREFDNVFILLQNLGVKNEDCKRQLYVAITRAKSNLTIHYDRTFLSNLIAHQLTQTVDKAYYDAPAVLSRVLTLHDVQLGYFDFVQHRMGNLTSGGQLFVTDEGLNTEKGLVIKFSKDFSKTLESFDKKGYKIKMAKANFLVYWYNKVENKEVRTVLPELTLMKSNLK
ncbi:MAG: ATP-dependent helicase, partial [Sphingobacteriales bacterium]